MQPQLSSHRLYYTLYIAEIMYISCLCATPEGSTPPGILANDYLMLPTLLFFVILADGALQILGS
jgi:hypothetical protein